MFSTDTPILAIADIQGIFSQQTYQFQVLLAVLYTAIKYRKDLGILDHYEDGSFGEKAKAEITRRRKELSENGNDTEEIERVGG